MKKLAGYCCADLESAGANVQLHLELGLQVRQLTTTHQRGRGPRLAQPGLLYRYCRQLFISVLRIRNDLFRIWIQL